jgi:hypothetical protein
MKVITIALVASALALSSTFAVAKTVRHKPNVGNSSALQRAAIPLVGPGSFHPNYDYGVSAGGSQSNGRSASERGGY